MQKRETCSPFLGRWCSYGTRKASGSSSWRRTSSRLTGTRRLKGKAKASALFWGFFALDLFRSSFVLWLYKATLFLSDSFSVLSYFFGQLPWQHREQMLSGNWNEADLFQIGFNKVELIFFCPSALINHTPDMRCPQTATYPHWCAFSHAHEYNYLFEFFSFFM